MTLNTLSWPSCCSHPALDHPPPCHPILCIVPTDRFMRTRPDKSPQEATPPGVLVDMYRRQTRRMGGSGAAAGAAAGGGS